LVCWFFEKESPSSSNWGFVSAYDGHALYCQLWPTPLYNISPHYLIKGTIFGKTLLDIKFVF